MCPSLDTNTDIFVYICHSNFNVKIFLTTLKFLEISPVEVSTINKVTTCLLFYLYLLFWYFNNSSDLNIKWTFHLKIEIFCLAEIKLFYSE